MAASTLQGSLDVVLHGATADETRQHMWLLAESAVGEPTSAAIFAEYAQVLLLLRSPQPAENEEATPPPINGDGVDVTDAWLRLQTITPSGEAWLWIRMGGDRGQQTYGIRHWLEAMQARRMLRIGPLFEWRPTPMGTEA
jgi:hypothetical protein